MKNIKLYQQFIVLILIAVISSCSTDTPSIDNTFEYKDFLKEESSLVEADSAILSHSITIPEAKINSFWKSSNFSLRNIPQNLSSKINLSNPQIRNYKVSSSSEADTDRNPVIYKDKIFTLSNNFLYSYSLDNPKKLEWRTELTSKKDNLIGGGIYVDNNKIAVTYGGKEIILVNADTGNKIWSHNLANIARASPSIYKNSVFINTIDNSLHSIDLKTGFLKWAIKEAHENLGFFGYAAPEPFEDSIIIPFSSGKLSSINSETGEVKWSATLSMGMGTQSYVNDIDMIPVIKDGVIYISSKNGILYAITAAEGKLEWTNHQAGGHNQIWTANDYLYTINKNNQLLAIFKVTGSIKWVYDLEKIKKNKKDNIFFDEEHTRFSGPTMINGNLYILSSDGKLMVIDAKTGKKIQDIKISKGSYPPAISVDEKIYLLSNSGTLSVIN